MLGRTAHAARVAKEKYMQSFVKEKSLNKDAIFFLCFADRASQYKPSNEPFEA